MPGLDDYKPVKQRIHEFRQQHPDWTIRTKLRITSDGAHWMSRTVIRDDTGRFIASGHAYEQARKPFDAEKTETSSVGRALVFAGWTDSLELSQEEIERSENVAGPVPQTAPIPAPRDPGPATPQKMQAQIKSGEIGVHTNPNPLPIEDMMRLEKPVQSAPKGFWQEFVKELVVADQTGAVGVPWRELTHGKGFNDLSTKELKSLVEDVDKWLHSEDEL